MAKTKKQIAFDLDTKMLELYYPKNNWRKAYDDIKQFMHINNFSWVQGSVYISNDPVSNGYIQNLLTVLCKDNEYLNKCMRDCVVTNIGKVYSLNKIFNKDINIPIPKKEPFYTNMIFSNSLDENDLDLDL